jgi:hypothetical protein
MGHVMVEGDGINAALGYPRQAAYTIERDLDGIILTLQIFLDEPAQAGIIIDVENARAGPWH